MNAPITLIRNFFSLAAAEIAGKVITFVAIVYLARIAGPEGFGYLEYAGAALFCASLLVEQGFGSYGAREIAKKPERTPQLVRQIVLIRFIIAILACAGLAGFALLIPHPAIVVQLLLLYGLSLLGAPLLLQWVFQGHDRMSLVAAAQIIRQGIFAMVVFAAVRDASGIWIAAVAEVAAVSAAALFCVAAYRSRFSNRRTTEFGLNAGLLRESIPIGLSQLFWVARIFGATLILGTIAPPNEVGFFSAAMRIFVALHTFVWLYYFNLLPSLARSWQSDRRAFASLTGRSLLAVGWSGALAGVTLILISPVSIAWIYGQKFASAGEVLRWLVLMAVAASLSGHYRFGLIAAGRQNIEMMLAAAGAAAAVILIPVGYLRYGPAGAAMALVTGETIVWLGSWWAGRSLLGLHGHLKIYWRPLPALILSLFLIYSVPFAPLLIRLSIVVATIAVSAWVAEPDFRSEFKRILLGRQAPELSANK